MSVSFKTDNVEISAVRDRAMFNTFAGNQSYVIKGVGDELALTYSSSSFVVSIGTGEAVICGGSTLAEGTNEITLSQNQNGYIVIRVDLTQVGENICQFKSVSSLVQENINDEGYVYDFPLAQYTTNGNGVSSLVDTRVMKDNLYIKTINGNTPNNEGNIAVNTGVLKVNNIVPNSSGNFTLNAGTNAQLTNGTNALTINTKNDAFQFTSGTLLNAIINNPNYNTFIKTGSAAINDFPAIYQNAEATIITVRNGQRINVIWQGYAGNNQDVFTTHIFNGTWNSAGWRRISSYPFKIWENPNKTSEFVAQEISLVGSIYLFSRFLVVFKMGTDLNNYETVEVVRGAGNISYRPSMVVSSNPAGIRIVYRIFTLTSVSINFSRGVDRENYDDTKMIPIYIYGI